MELPTKYDKKEFEKIKKSAKKIQENSEILVVIGIGGSYLGARAAIEFLRSPNYRGSYTYLLCIFAKRTKKNSSNFICWK